MSRGVITRVVLLQILPPSNCWHLWCISSRLINVQIWVLCHWPERHHTTFMYFEYFCYKSRI